MEVVDTATQKHTEGIIEKKCPTLTFLDVIGGSRGRKLKHTQPDKRKTQTHTQKRENDGWPGDTTVFLLTFVVASCTERMSSVRCAAEWNGIQCTGSTTTTTSCTSHQPQSMTDGQQMDPTSKLSVCLFRTCTRWVDKPPIVSSKIQKKFVPNYQMRGWNIYCMWQSPSRERHLWFPRVT